VSKTLQRQSDDQSVRRVVTAIAVFAAVVGLVLVVRLPLGSSTAYALQTEVETDSALSIWVEDFRWLSVEMDGDDDNGIDGPQDQDSDGDQSYAMPNNMMPGAPNSGFQRLQVNLSFINRGADVAYLEPADFLLVATNGDSWATLTGGTFDETVLGPLQAMSTTVAFDVPVERAISGMDLIWSWDGDSSSFAIAGADGADHG